MNQTFPNSNTMRVSPKLSYKQKQKPRIQDETYLKPVPVLAIQRQRMLNGYLSCTPRHAEQEREQESKYTCVARHGQSLVGGSAPYLWYQDAVA